MISQTRKKLEIRDRILAALTEAQKLRNNNQEFHNNELRWITYERLVMHKTTNQNSEKFVPIDEIRRVERLAEGHSDYSEKFALYCAELAVGE